MAFGYNSIHPNWPIRQLLSKGTYLEESDDGNLVVLDELLGGVNVLEGHGRRSGLLLHPGDDGVGGSATVVLDSLAVAESRGKSLIR